MERLCRQLLLVKLMCFFVSTEKKNNQKQSRIITPHETASALWCGDRRWRQTCGGFLTHITLMAELQIQCRKLMALCTRKKKLNQPVVGLSFKIRDRTWRWNSGLHRKLKVNTESKISSYQMKITTNTKITNNSHRQPAIVCSVWWYVAAQDPELTKQFLTTQVCSVTLVQIWWIRCDLPVSSGSA